jgi:hypothetical protein
MIEVLNLGLFTGVGSIPVHTDPVLRQARQQLSQTLSIYDKLFPISVP